MCDNRAMWKDVPGYEGIYQANQKLGIVRSLDRVIIDKAGNYRRLRGRMLHGTGNNPNSVILSRNGIQTVFTVHDIIELTFGAQIPA